MTFDPPDQIDEFTRSVGWCSQAEPPKHYQAADIGSDDRPGRAASITSVEAMAAGIPVVASRIGGVPYTVTDGFTGCCSIQATQSTWPGRSRGCSMIANSGEGWD